MITRIKLIKPPSGENKDEGKHSSGKRKIFVPFFVKFIFKKI